MAEFTAAILWTDETGRDQEEVASFETEAEAREWLNGRSGNENATKELWHGRYQIEL